jgi:hypothetical protein
LHRPSDRSAQAAPEAAYDRWRRIARSAVNIIAKVIHADGFDDRIIEFTGLAQHEAEGSGRFSQSEFLRV